MTPACDHQTTWQPYAFSDNPYRLSALGNSQKVWPPQAMTFNLVFQVSVRPTSKGWAKKIGSGCISSEAGRVAFHDRS